MRFFQVKPHLDLRGTKFGDLLGFDEKILTATEYSARLPNITNSVDKINIHSDIVSNSILSGYSNNLLAVIPSENLTRSYSFNLSPGGCYSVKFRKDI